MKYLFYFFLFVFSLIFSTDLAAQSNEGVCIAASLTPPDASAMLEVQSNSKGMLIPRMTIADRNAIVAPVVGLWIFQIDNTPGFYYWDGTIWQCMSCCCSAIDEPWKEVGSTGTLFDGSQIPGFNSCFAPVTTATVGHQKLSIRKMPNGKIHLKGEFLLNCPLTGSCLYLFSPYYLSDGYNPASNVFDIISPVLINGSPFPALISLCHTMQSGIALGKPIDTSGLVMPAIGSTIYIDIQYTPVQ